MKKNSLLGILLLLAFVPLAQGAESKRTAEYIIANSADYEGKEVTLDVAFVKPAQSKSPVPELAFYHAMTIDRRDRKMGGRILVAIPAKESGAFAKKYGMDFDGRGDSDILRGTFMSAPVRALPRKKRGGVWLIDTTGKVAELVRSKKLQLDDASPEGRPR